MKKFLPVLIMVLALATPALAGGKSAPAPSKPTAQQLQAAIAQRQEQINQITGEMRKLDLMRKGLAAEAGQLEAQRQAMLGKGGRPAPAGGE